MKALITVIIPVYNAARYLRRSLDSLLGQTYRELEIICVNDGSTDESVSILTEYAGCDSRVKVIHQENSGVSAARNAGLDAATGEYVTFVDADDWVESDAYEKLMKHAPDGVDLICFGTQVEGDISDAEKEESMSYLNRLSDGVIAPSVVNIESMNGCVWNKLFRREMIEKYHCRFPVGVPYGEDTAFVYCAAAIMQQAYGCTQHLYHYLIHPASATGCDFARSCKALLHLKVVQYVKQFVDVHRIRCEKKNELVASVFVYAYSYVLSRMTGELREEAQRAALVVGRETGALRNRYQWRIRELLSQTQCPLLRFVRRFEANRVCYGIGRFALLSITYETERKIYRLLGRVICVRQRVGW